MSAWLKLYINQARLVVNLQGPQNKAECRDKTSLFFHLFIWRKLGWALPKHGSVAERVIFFGIMDYSLTSVHPKTKRSSPVRRWILLSCYKIRFYVLCGLAHSIFFFYFSLQPLQWIKRYFQVKQDIIKLKKSHIWLNLSRKSLISIEVYKKFVKPKLNWQGGLWREV